MSHRDRFRNGITFRSLGAILLAMALMAVAINFGGSIEGALIYVASEPLPVPAMWMLVGFSLVSALAFLATKRRLLSRAEMFCILFSCLIAAPLMNHGFWRYMLGRMATIPRFADFEKLDAYSDKLWPHGPNITEGLLESAGKDRFVTRGYFSRTMVEYDVGLWEELPTLVNANPDDLSSFEVALPLRERGESKIYPGQPYMLSVQIQARDVEPASTYFCRIYTDDSQKLLEEAFTASGETARTYLHKTGFRRLGMYGLFIPFGTTEKIRLEFSLAGIGKAVFRDLQLMNVSALNDAYEGVETITRAEYARLPESHRVGKKVRPDSIFSLEGIRFLFTAYVPLGQWATPVFVWASFTTLMLAASFAFSVIMRRQWVDRERFLLPLMQVPRYLIGFDGEGDNSRPLPPIWRNPLMWAGFVLVLCWCLIRAWALVDPSAPELEVNIPLKAYFTDPAAMSMLSNVNFSILAMAVGLALFMDLHISLSLLIGYFLFRAQYWVGEAQGLNVEAGYPFQDHQITAAFLAYALLIFIQARRHLWGVVVEAVRGVRQPDEVFSSRQALLVLLLSFFGVILWSLWMDLPIRGMLLFFVFLLAIAITVTKLRAECGVPFRDYFPQYFFYMVPIVGGLTFLTPEGSMVWLLFAVIMGVTTFFLIPGIQFEMIEAGKRLRVRPRHILYTGLLGLFGGFFVGGWLYLAGCYGYGASYFGDLVSYDPEIQRFGNFVEWHAKATHNYLGLSEGGENKDGLSGAHWAMLFSAGGTGFTVMLRQLFVGFWFHPAGFILGPSRMMQNAWGSILVACLLRFAVLKLGGAQMVKAKLYPFAIGVLLGSVAAQAVILALNTWFYYYQPGTPGIPVTY